MADPYYGVEFVESQLGSATVYDRKSATCFIIGTAPIGDVHDTAEKRAKYINKPILIRSRKDAVAAFGNHKAGFTIPSALDAIFDHSGAQGIGVLEVVNVYDPDTHATVADVNNLDIIGEFSPLGIPTGLKLAYDSYQRFGRFCKIIIAPGFSGLTGIRAELVTICNRIRARAIIDAPAGVSSQQAIEARGPLGSFDLQSNSRRLTYAWPHMKVVDLETGNERLDPYSARFAGVWLRSIIENGHQHSPSNRPIFGIEGAAQPVLYIPGDHQSEVQGLRSVGIVTVEERYGKGPHTSGNRSAAHPTDSDMRNFLHVQFTEDMLIEEGLHFLDQYKDRNVTPQLLELLEDRMNGYLRGKMTGDNPVISDGQFRFDRTKTTKETASQGHFYFNMPWAPVGIAERITVTQHIDLNLLGNALGLATAS